jgi:hypothetical protein
VFELEWRSLITDPLPLHQKICRRLRVELQQGSVEGQKSQEVTPQLTAINDHMNTHLKGAPCLIHTWIYIKDGEDYKKNTKIQDFIGFWHEWGDLQNPYPSLMVFLFLKFHDCSLRKC